MVFGPTEHTLSRWPSAELYRTLMFISKKFSARRRLFICTLFLLFTFTLVVIVNQKHVININYDLPIVPSWSSNKILRNESIRLAIDAINEYQTIWNAERFEPLQNDSVVIVVQVHKRITYLRHLIKSLSKSRDISKTLLIFSHDFYDEEINGLVQSIDFCRVMQIFYPFSIQTHPNEFPGTDPEDCERGVTKKNAIDTKCKNANFPDLYGHYREAAYTQMKHHWWWKLNRIFDQLDVTRNHTGLLLLLEEDYYVAPDFLYILKELEETAPKLCAHCNVLSLGTYLPTISRDNYYQVEVSPWITSKHNMGMAFNRKTWNEVKSCAKYFCDYDDYNYDWSLQNINYKCLKEKLFAMIIRGPRVFHIGECGMHHHDSNLCDSSRLITKVQNVIQHATKSGFLFPKNLKLSRTFDSDDVSDNLKPNGGWADLRDILLCLNMTLTGG